MNSIGIDLSKEGHDESPIIDTKHIWSKMFWSKPDSRVIYETDSGITNMIEGKLTADSENMTKLISNMGMA